jgi:hypothetical protein
MRTKNANIGCILALMCSLSLSAWSAPQEAAPAPIVRIGLVDKSELIGTILTEDKTAVTFRTISGLELTIERRKIIFIEPMEMVGGKAMRTDPNETRLFLAPTARPLKAGQGYFSVYEIVLPYFAVGLTDFLALGGGMTLIPGASEQLFYVAPKLTVFQAKDLDLAAGVLYASSTGSGASGIGVIYALGTAGKKSLSVTGGLGWGYSGDGFANRPILMIGAEAQISDSVKLLTENWIPMGSNAKFLSFGVRFFGRNLAADFGLMLPPGSNLGGFPFIPWIGFSYNFGGRR